jgi:site-specific DNA-methyltransferase (adenine-specific)
MSAIAGRAEIKLNCRQQMDGWQMLRNIPDERAALAILDPQYRGGLDKLAFGNEGARQKKRAELPQMPDRDIALFMEQIERVLKPSGHVFLWLDKFSICSGHHLRYFHLTEWLKLVDLLCWEKKTFGMGRRLRCTTEYLVVAQKEPTNARDHWRDHGIRDFWSEAADRAAHPHAKPVELTRRLIESVTRPGELVVDPCAGSYSTLDACEATGRAFVGCDLLE